MFKIVVHDKRKWRNWQTHSLEVAALARAWGGNPSFAAAPLVSPTLPADSDNHDAGKGNID